MFSSDQPSPPFPLFRLSRRWLFFLSRRAAFFFARRYARCIEKKRERKSEVYEAKTEIYVEKYPGEAIRTEIPRGKIRYFHDDRVISQVFHALFNQRVRNTRYTNRMISLRRDKSSLRYSSYYVGHSSRTYLGDFFLCGISVAKLLRTWLGLSEEAILRNYCTLSRS